MVCICCRRRRPFEDGKLCSDCKSERSTSNVRGIASLRKKIRDSLTSHNVRGDTDE